MFANFLTGSDNAEAFEDAVDDLADASLEYVNAADMAKRSVAALSLELGSVAKEAKLADYEFLQGVQCKGRWMNAVHNALDISQLEFLTEIVREGASELDVLSDNYKNALSSLNEQFGVTGEQAQRLVSRAGPNQDRSRPGRNR